MAHGDPSDLFAFPDFDQTSTWLSPVEPHISFHLNLAEDDAKSRPNLAFRTAEDGFFQIPDLFGLQRLEQDAWQDENPEPAEEPLHDASLSDVDVLDDIWQAGQHQLVIGTGHKTWDAFLSPDASSVRPIFITEAGPQAYDAALLAENDPLKIDSVGHLVIQTNAYLASLLALSLGRASVFFLWQEKDAQFRPVSKTFRISGYSTACLQDLQSSCIRSGTRIRYLSAYVRLTYKRRTSPVKIALAKTVDIILLAIQRQLGDYGGKVRTTLQLQSLIEPVEAVLAHIRDLVTKLSRIKTDEQILSKLFHETSLLENENSLVRQMMCEILSRVSEPWTDFSEKWIGVKPEEGNQMALDGPGKSFAKVVRMTRVDDFGFEAEEPEYILDEACMPSFVPIDIALVMFEAGKTLRLLRTYHPNHSLCRVGAIVSSGPPTFRWLFDWESIEKLQDDVRLYEEAMLRIILNKEAVRGERSGDSVLDESDQAMGLDVFGCDGSQLESQLLASIRALDQPPPTATREDRLSRLIDEHIFQQNSEPKQAVSNFNPHWSLLPLHSFGPLVSAQARLINREYMRLLFSTHNLREHLRVQKEYQLLGNGMFCSRLSHALFDVDLEPAERQAGVALQGGIMGLRMTGRDNWPPASSELRLSLMGILSETYAHPSSGPLDRGHGETKDLPGDLSFTIRDMTEEEIEKCIDPNSLEALDFLRLSYKAPKPLSPILTAGLLVKYDRIFKMLLRLLRLLYVIGQVFRDTSRLTRPGRATCNSWFRFQTEARHFVQSISNYFFDVGIQVPWERFEKWLDQVQSDPEQRRNRVVSPDEVREEHERMLDHILHTLLLRKRQQPVLSLLEDILGLILKFSRQTQLEAAGKVEDGVSQVIIDSLYNTFKKKVGIFVAVCQSLNEKGNHTGKATKREGMTVDDIRQKDNGKEEVTIDRLLVKLDLLGYYSHSRF
ncbi:Spc97/Spc98 family protein [Xylariaceae sp. FL0255]|nr:Spc97/Spc98 family protein [Xylariaceae sp. FL0255]